MIESVKFTVNRLLEECVSQSSIDFSALRVGQPEAADASYKDYVLSSDKSAEFNDALNIEAALFAAEFRHTINCFDGTGDTLHWKFLLEDSSDYAGVLCPLVFSYFKYRMLVWWFTGRNEKLQHYYAERAERAKNSINNMTRGGLASRTLRFF
ncbi:MAG: hypothetical protein IJC47_04430 [Alistipes sp.]|nr:hypothetical protein [Alistipes sp.]